MPGGARDRGQIPADFPSGRGADSGAGRGLSENGTFASAGPAPGAGGLDHLPSWFQHNDRQSQIATRDWNRNLAAKKQNHGRSQVRSPTARQPLPSVRIRKAERAEPDALLALN